MPKRKLVQETELSDLSPPPNGLLDEPQANGVSNGVAKAPITKKRKTKQVKEETVATEAHVNGAKSTKPGRTVRKKEVKYEEEPDSDEEPKAATPRGKKRKIKVEEEVDVQQYTKENGSEKKVKRKRKTKEEKEAEAMPLAARTAGHKLFIGAHVSAAGGTIYSLNSMSRVHMLRSLCRCPQLRPKQRPHRCQCLRSFPEKPTEMGESATCRGCLQFFPHGLQVSYL